MSERTQQKINSLKLKNFRNFVTRELSFHPQSTLIVGENGRGKTNILEAICLFSTGKPIHSSLLSECIRFGEEAMHLALDLEIDHEPQELSFTVLAKTQTNHAHTKYTQNGVHRQKSSVVGVVKTITFFPQDMEIIIGGPAKKRDFLDSTLLQVSDEYRHALSEYERALKHRNKLIAMLKEGNAKRSDFFIWDALLIRHADTLVRERARFIHFINDFVPFPIQANIVYVPSLMTQERLYEHAVAEVGAGRTLIGPHKDTFHIHMHLTRSNQLEDVGTFGSRGQQRMAVLWLKIASLAFLEEETNCSALLLLDDIFSELDQANRELLFSFFGNHQFIMTSAEPIAALPSLFQGGDVITLDKVQ